MVPSGCSSSLVNFMVQAVNQKCSGKLPSTFVAIVVLSFQGKFAWQTISVICCWTASTHRKLKCSLSLVLHAFTFETPMYRACK
uniref:Uncharacterized protein n=1 Tax=Arundo donax TaxID=35708 RepID=A0A0A8Z4N9_ARUDO